MGDVPEESVLPGSPGKTHKPLKEVVPQTTQFVYRNAKALFRLGWVPYSGILVLDLSTFFLEENLALGIWADVGILGMVLLSLFLIVLFSTSWHRYTLSSVDLVSRPLGLRWGKAEWRFLGFLILFYAIPFLVLFFATMIGVLGESTFLWVILSLAFGLPVLLLLIRACLVFPSAAIGTNIKLKESYSATVGHVWTMMGSYVLLYVVASFVVWPLSLASNSLVLVFPEGQIVVKVTIIFLQTLIWMIVNAAAVSLLSFMYLRLVHDQQVVGTQA